MSNIKPIDKTSVHKICSGQVVLNLATAVKELVENSLDAESSNIEIKLKEYGASLIEVSDDGTGVEENNYGGLTLKHHTSKISDFNDLSFVSTFGFRGEALSSLCALCDLTITTRHKDTLVGHKIKYNHSGGIVSKTQFARLPGTTVSIQDIFSTLPVRYKEFQKHVKREYKKMLAVINSYCVIADAKITCMNLTAKGKRTTLISTQGTGKMFDNITSVFGRHEAKTLIEFKQEKPSEEVCETFFIDYEFALKSCDLYTISGYISGCTTGRNATDRQLFFINNRPCDLPKLAKVVNDAFHVIDRHHYPFVVLNISVVQDRVDVNVTPDKRQIFLEDEKVIFAIIRTSLLNLYTGGTGHDIGRGCMSSGRSQVCEKDNLNDESQRVFAVVNQENLQTNVKCPQQNIAQFESNCNRNKNNTNNINKNVANVTQNFLSQFKNKLSKHDPSTTTNKIVQNRKRTLDSMIIVSKKPKLENSFVKNDTSEESNCLPTQQNTMINKDTITEQKNTSANDDSSGETYLQEESTNKTNEQTVITNEFVLDTDLDQDNITVAVKNISLSISNLKKRIYKVKEIINSSKNSDLKHVFSAKIDPIKNSLAEKELTKYLSKDAFTSMEIIGQFNMGFIIALHNRDVFIIDQHATDEKYNFEMLQKNSVLKGQRLIVPQKLEITAGDFLVLEESMNIFEQNGFQIEFKCDDNDEKIAYLTSVPGSLGNSYSFGCTDILEMIFMLNGMPGVMCRPSRIRQMFASKACRKSVMIGSALNKSEMERLVRHMGEMNQPWNCPHGRPTMRHLVDLSMIQK